MVRRPTTRRLESIRRDRHPRALAEPASDAPGTGDEAEPQPAASAVPPTAPPSLDGLTVAGFTRRRAAFLAGTFATIWIVAVFARQVGDASAATAKADSMRAENAAVASEVAALQAEVEQIQQTPFIAQQARGYDLGAPNERAFTLSPGAPPLASDAPGSAAVRLGSVTTVRSPLESWLSVLFGPPAR